MARLHTNIMVYSILITGISNLSRKEKELKVITILYEIIYEL